jgi:hypothetical protein
MCRALAMPYLATSSKMISLMRLIKDVQGHLLTNNIRRISHVVISVPSIQRVAWLLINLAIEGCCEAYCINNNNRYILYVLSF